MKGDRPLWKAYFDDARRLLFSSDTECGIVSQATYNEKTVAPSGNTVDWWYLSLEGGKEYQGCLGVPIYLGPDQNQLKGEQVTVDTYRILGIPLCVRIKRGSGSDEI